MNESASRQRGILYIVLGCVVMISLVMIVGILSLAIIAYPNYINAQTRALVAKTQSEQRMLENALEAFSLDNRGYPIMHGGEDWFPEAFPEAENPNRVATINNAFRTPENGDVPHFLLTTPIAYVSNLPMDSFRQMAFGFGYGSDGQNYYVLTSYGPDEVDGIGGPDGEFLELQYTGAQPGDGNAAFRGAPLPIEAYLYHPSNGLKSAGDIMRFRQARGPVRYAP